MFCVIIGMNWFESGSEVDLLFRFFLYAVSWNAYSLWNYNYLYLKFTSDCVLECFLELVIIFFKCHGCIFWLRHVWLILFRQRVNAHALTHSVFRHGVVSGLTMGPSRQQLSTQTRCISFPMLSSRQLRQLKSSDVLSYQPELHVTAQAVQAPRSTSTLLSEAALF